MASKDKETESLRERTNPVAPTENEAESKKTIGEELNEPLLSP